MRVDSNNGSASGAQGPERPVSDAARAIESVNPLLAERMRSAAETAFAVHHQLANQDVSFKERYHQSVVLSDAVEQIKSIDNLQVRQMLRGFQEELESALVSVDRTLNPLHAEAYERLSGLTRLQEAVDASYQELMARSVADMQEPEFEEQVSAHLETLAAYEAAAKDYCAHYAGDEEAVPGDANTREKIERGTAKRMLEGRALKLTQETASLLRECRQFEKGNSTLTATELRERAEQLLQCADEISFLPTGGIFFVRPLANLQQQLDFKMLIRAEVQSDPRFDVSITDLDDAVAKVEQADSGTYVVFAPPELSGEYCVVFKHDDEVKAEILQPSDGGLEVSGSNPRQVHNSAAELVRIRTWDPKPPEREIAALKKFYAEAGEQWMQETGAPLMRISRRNPLFAELGLTRSYFIADNGQILQQLPGKEQDKGFVGRGGFKVAYELVDEHGEAVGVRARMQEVGTAVDAEFQKRLASALADEPYCAAGRFIEYMGYHTEDERTERVPRRVWTMNRFGTDLDKLMESAPVSENGDLLQKAAGQIIDGLAAAHAKGIAHMDLKPANFFANIKKGQIEAALADWDLAMDAERLQAFVREHGGEGYKECTPYYGAPELLLGGSGVSTIEQAQKADVFSLGIALHGMLLGELPGWAADRQLHSYGRPTESELAECFQGKIPPEAPDSIQRLLYEMLQNNPEARPAMEQVQARWQKLSAR